MSQDRTRVAVIACLITPFLGGCDKPPSVAAPSFKTEYQAVFMQSGQVFFGKLEMAGGDYATLRDVYFIQQQVNPETKQGNSVLLKRSADLHAPDVMYINARQIALIEPVATTSRVAQLIKQAETQPAAPTAP